MSKSDYVVIKIPRDIVEGARIPEKEFEMVARIELAVALYAKGDTQPWTSPPSRWII